MMSSFVFVRSRGLFQTLGEDSLIDLSSAHVKRVCHLMHKCEKPKSNNMPHSKLNHPDPEQCPQPILKPCSHKREEC